ncbi:MAG: radical SAM protein [Polyangiaceae bacterium]|nr:radical SAM protein [Polyangiaceae bacterium]
MALPPRADVKVGFACNNRCLFCAQGEKRTDCGALPIEEIVRRLIEVRKTTSSVVLTGGEPTLYKHILHLVRAASRLGFAPIQIQTNGRLLAYPNVLSALIAAGATEISPSLHGSTAEIHDELTRAAGSFAQSVEGIRNVVAQGAVIVTNSVITRKNVHDLPALVDLLGSLGVRKAQLAFVHPVGTAEVLFDDVVPRLPDVVEPVAQARRIAERRGMFLTTEAIPYCFLRGMETLAVEGSIPPTTVVDLDGHVADYSNWRQYEGKAHGPPCSSCARRPRCEGPWREYPAKFGWDEFVPFDTGAP